METKEEKEFDSIIEIDKTRLDDEAENQPYLVWEYGKHTAKAIKELDEAKANLRVVEAEVDVDVRENPANYDLETDKKPPETAIRCAILRSEEYKEANQKVIDAQYKVNIFEAANKSLDHRRTSLTMLDGQDGRNYFSRPKQSKNLNVKDFRGKHKC